MSVKSSLGAFNKDKVANKFGIQLKPKDASTASSGTSTVTKNKTIGDFRTDKSTNGFLNNTNRPVGSKTPEPTRKVIEKTSPINKSSTVNINQQSTTLTSNVNHSTTKSKESLSPTTTTKRTSQTPAQRAASPTPPAKKQQQPQPAAPKPEASNQSKKDQPLYRRQSSKPLDNTPSTPTTATTTTTAAATSTSSLKR
jgi:hypothetical protein